MPYYEDPAGTKWKKAHDKSAYAIPKTNAEYKLNLPNLSSGAYLPEIYYSGKTNETKFVITKK